MLEIGIILKTGFLESQSISRVKCDRKTITNILLSMTRTPIHNFKLLSEIKIIKGVFFIIKPVIDFKTMSGFPFLDIS